MLMTVEQVSQNWFGESERGLATLILGMSNPLGLVLGQSLTPLLVPTPDQIPLLNIVWFIPSIPGFLFTMFGVRSSLPPTPPSKSAACASMAARRPFLDTIYQLATNKPFFIIFLFLGGAMGYISTLQTKLEQVVSTHHLISLRASYFLFNKFFRSLNNNHQIKAVEIVGLMINLNKSKLDNLE